MIPGIDVELKQALRVDPSADFVARVRMRIADEPPPARWRFAWAPMAVAGAVAVAALAVVVARWTPAVTPVTSDVLTARALVPVAAQEFGPPIAGLKTRATTDVPVATTDVPVATTDVPVAQDFSPANTNPEADILIDAREAAALRRLILGAQSGRVDLHALLEPSPWTAVDPVPVTDLEIAPILVEPLERGEGVRQ